MIDGVKCTCYGLNAALWRNNPLLDFGISVSETTGELLTQRREAKHKDMRFILSPSAGGGFRYSIAGSLHKHAQGNNYGDFTITDLSGTLDSLTENYHIDLSSAHIHGLEVGVNIELDYDPEIVFKKAVCHKGVPFEKLDAKDKRLGIVCNHTNYSIKLYSKSYQCKIDNKYILRYEVKLFKQKELQPYGIATLADLKNGENVTSLIALLLDRLNEIVFFDYSFNAKSLSVSKQLRWAQYGNPRFWESLDRNNYYKARKKLADLTEKYNCIDWGLFLSKKVKEKWLKLTISKHKNRRHFPRLSEPHSGGYFYRIFTPGKQIKQATFSPFNYIRENVAKRGHLKGEKKEVDTGIKKRNKTDQKNRKKNSKENTICFCVSCGRKLTGQRKGSRFCSEKIYGRAARKCRNKDSNKRLAVKRKIKRAANKDLKLLVTYRDKGKQNKTILAAGKVIVSREWLDRVSSVEVDKSKVHIRGVP